MNTEFRAIMAGVALVCTLAPLTLIRPIIDTIATAVLLGAAGAALAGYWFRELVRELRFRTEMRALDARDAMRRTRIEVRA
jgi:hypothetical protein